MFAVGAGIRRTKLHELSLKCSRAFMSGTRVAYHRQQNYQQRSQENDSVASGAFNWKFRLIVGTTAAGIFLIYKKFSYLYKKWIFFKQMQIWIFVLFIFYI